MSDEPDPNKKPLGRLWTTGILFVITFVVGSFMSSPTPPPEPDRTDAQRQRAREIMEQRLKNSVVKPVIVPPPLVPVDDVQAQLRLLEELLKDLPLADSLERQYLEQRIDALRKRATTEKD